MEEALRYFSIGHGDFNEELGFEPKFIVWTYLNGHIETDDSGGTHGLKWGHDVAGKTFKGRYEPETGRLSIVRPSGRESETVPEIVMEALYAKFDFIKDISVF